MKTRIVQILSVTALTVVLVACGGEPKKATENEKTSEDHSEMDHSSNTADATAELLPIPENASVSFGAIEKKETTINPETGEENFTYSIQFNVEGMEVEPAGELNEGKGHHHLIINGGPIERGTVVPADSVNIHYGKGQTETELSLSRGEYTLTMQFADGYHQSYGEQMSATTSLVVE